MAELADEKINYETGLKLGDTVLTRRTGLPTMGKVIGMILGPLFVAQNNYTLLGREEEDGSETLQCVNHQGGRPCPTWDNLYPNWFLDPVCYVKFDKQQKTMSFQEFRTMREWDESLSEDAIRAYYDIECPTSNVIAYPLQDLEKYE